MKSTVVYIHGFDSSPAAQTAQAIKKHFKNERFICPHIDHRQDPDFIRKTMDHLATLIREQDDPVVVGSSAGGLWADYLAVKYGFKTVLINPALKPTITFKRFDLPEAYMKKYAKMEKDLKGKTRRNIVVFSGDQDDVVTTEHVKTHYPKPRILKGEGHRIQDTSPIFTAIERMIGNFPEHV